MQKSVEYKPNDANGRRNLALALYRMGRVKEAVPQAEQAVKLAGGRDPNMLALLSRLYAESGRMPEAVDAARRALALVPNPSNFQFAEELRQRIAQNPATRR
jgi:tetratricopeptide (TPR) repeat protein